MSCDYLEFQKIHEAFRPKIYRYLTHLIGEHEAEDLTQEVFVKVSRALGTFRGESQLSTWLYRIASNAAIDKIRSLSFRQDAQKCSLDDSSEDEGRDMWIGEEPPLLEQQFMRKERYQCFGNFVENLPPHYRTVVVLSELGELSNKEIAQVLGLSLDAVKIRLHRGRARLFRELKTHCKVEDWL
jgi:RNA polymerase sigma-70 factor, ECF subfamily